MLSFHRKERIKQLRRLEKRMRNDLILRDNEKGRLDTLPAVGHSFTKSIFVGHVCKI